MRNILIIGKNGQIARNLANIIDKAIIINREELDLTNLDNIENILSKYETQIIINAAAYTFVDKAETEWDIAEKVNGSAPGIIAEYARKNNIKFVHYSTDYIFRGDGDSPIGELNEIDPLSNYGKSKLIGENNIIKSNCNYLILRTSSVYDAIGANFVNTIIRLAMEKDELNIVANQYFSPSYAPDIAKSTIDIINRWNGDSNIYNIANTGYTSWYNFAIKILEYAKGYNIPVKINKINPINQDQYKSLAKRPLYSVLNLEKLENDYAIKLPFWEDSLKSCIKQISLNKGYQNEN